jgi:hypothetical protein
LARPDACITRVHIKTHCKSEPKPENVDEESKSLWADFDRAARVMAARIKEREDRAAAFRKQQREKEKERARVAEEQRQLKERLRKEKERLREERLREEKGKQEEERNRLGDTVEESEAFLLHEDLRGRKSSKGSLEHRETRASLIETRASLIEQVRTILEELLMLEFETEEEAEAVLQDYVERMKRLEEQEEAMIRKNRRALFFAVEDGLSGELHEFLPGYMQDLCYGPTGENGARRRLPRGQHNNFDYLLGYSSSDSESGKAGTAKSDHRKKGRRRRRRAIPVEMADTDENEFEVLMDAAMENGLSHVVRVLVAHAKKISKQKAQGMNTFREAIAQKFLPDVKTWPGYKMYYLPLKQDINDAFKVAKGILSDAVKRPVDAGDLSTMQTKFKQDRMEMKDDGKIGSDQSIVTGLEQLVDRTLGNPTTDAVNMPLPSNDSDTGKKNRKIGSTVSNMIIVHGQGNQSQLHEEDEYLGSQTVGAILAAEGDKRGDYFGELNIVMGEPRRHGLGHLHDHKLGSRIQGQWVSNTLQGFAAEMKADQSYSFGLYEKGKLSGLGWIRPQPGVKFGYLGAFQDGQPHGFGFKVSLSQGKSSDPSEVLEQNTDNTKEMKERREHGLDESDAQKNAQAHLSGRHPKSTVTLLRDRERQQHTGIMALASPMLYYEVGELVCPYTIINRVNCCFLLLFFPMELGLGQNLLMWIKAPIESLTTTFLTQVESVEGISELEVDGFKNRIAKFLQLAFVKV